MCGTIILNLSIRVRYTGLVNFLCDLRTNAMDADVCQTLYLSRFCDSMRPRYTARHWFDTSPRARPAQPNPLLPVQEYMHPALPQ